MRFQLSVFYEGGLYSYKINSDDKIRFDFELASSPANAVPVPQKFSVVHSASKEWVLENQSNKAFKEAVIKALKTTKL
ncbi:MAG: hypothetical protein ACJ75B_13345 [Flavisolibacter sp.]